jgi:predicted small lipoprotein YifL
MNNLIKWVLALSLGAILVGCDNKGPAERTGEKLDEAVQDTKRAVEDATD